MVRLRGLSPDSAWRLYRAHSSRARPEEPKLIEDPKAQEFHFEKVLGVL